MLPEPEVSLLYAWALVGLPSLMAEFEIAEHCDAQQAVGEDLVAIGMFEAGGWYTGPRTLPKAQWWPLHQKFRGLAWDTCDRIQIICGNKVEWGLVMQKAGQRLKDEAALLREGCSDQ